MDTSGKRARARLPMMLAVAFLGVTTGGAFAAEEPAVIRPIAPEYPRAAERRQIEGLVEVSIDVDADGSVTRVSVINSEPAGVFDSSAVNAVERWRFESGKPATDIRKNIRFKLEN